MIGVFDNGVYTAEKTIICAIYLIFITNSLTTFLIYTQRNLN